MWQHTASGQRFYALDPSPEELHIEDIAHALSNQCRFAGHTIRHYSVAEHSYHVSHRCDPADALWGLLHDASEAYLVDVPKPIKVADSMRGYREAEQALMDAVCARFGLPWVEPASVRQADIDVLFTERRDLLPPIDDPLGEWGMGLKGEPIAGLDLRAPVTPSQARALFLHRFETLTKGTV